ncbi:hypothetical protein BASA83_006939 [Batrachochytrium salamandrivorans]|nr:hypothetical protein BASA83_006939 [Batrachochytrium salamandrivorans]
MPAHHPQDDLWVVVKNLSQQVAAQQAEMDALRHTIALQQKATANLEKILATWQLALLLGSLFETRGLQSLHTVHPKVELSSGLRLIYASGFPYAKPGDLRKAMQGARIRTSAVRDIRWISRQVVQLLVDADYVSAFTRIITSLDAAIVKSFKAWTPRPEAAEKDKLAAISSFAAKTTLEAATAEATKIRGQTPDFSISTLETVPKEFLPVKKVTDKDHAAPAVDPPFEMAAGVTPAIQDDGVAPTVTPIADVEMCL